MTPVRGPALLSAVDGRLPRGDRDIMLGVATMRATGARVGGTVRVTVSDPAGHSHDAQFRVIGRASLNAGTGGLGNGAVMTTSAFLGAQCPPGRSQAGCQRSARQGMATVVLVRAAPGPAGHTAPGPVQPPVLRPHEPPGHADRAGQLRRVGELPAAVRDRPVAVRRRDHDAPAAGQPGRRRTETGLLKVLGFVRRQVAAAVCWQAATVALAGIAVGTPARDRGRPGAVAGIRHEFRRGPGAGGAGVAAGRAGRRGARGRQRAGRRARPAGRAIASRAAAPGGVARNNGVGTGCAHG